MANEGHGPWHHLLLGNGWGRGPQVGVASAEGASPSKLGSSGPGAGLWGSSPASLGRPLWAAAGAPRGVGGESGPRRFSRCPQVPGPRPAVAVQGLVVSPEVFPGPLVPSRPTG